jgi:NAD(P)-dependent dehydrogenase (short-subunit alcohol dehydrogenase family)
MEDLDPATRGSNATTSLISCGIALFRILDCEDSMASRYFDETVAERYRQFRFEFGSHSLRGRVIVLAGGTGGLGAAAAALLVHEGASLVVGYANDVQRAQRMQRALGAYGDGTISLCRADLRQAEGRKALLDAAALQGPLYGLTVFTGDPARGDGEEILRESLAINYLAPLLLAREAAAVMKSGGTAGSIVLFSSMQASSVFENSTAYAGAKAALVQGAKVLAKESGGSANIRVNVVAPGATLAGMAQASLRSGKYDRFVADGVVPRFGRAEDVARTVRFLLEPDNYITGQVITVDGGMTLRRDLR